MIVEETAVGSSSTGGRAAAMVDAINRAKSHGQRLGTRSALPNLIDFDPARLVVLW